MIFITRETLRRTLACAGLTTCLGMTAGCATTATTAVSGGSASTASTAETASTASTARVADDALYTLSARQHLDGPTRWDYLSFDDAAGLLYVSHVDTVDVYDVARKTVVAQIRDVHGVHGIALAKALDRGFASNGASDSVTIFSLSTHRTIASVPTEKGPDAIIFDPTAQRVFAMNGKAGSITAIDAVSGKALKSIALGGRPEFAAVDGRGHLYVNIEDRNAMVEVDTRSLALTRRFDLSAACDEPAGLSIDAQRNVLFVGCHDQKMVMVDAASGSIIGSVPIGKGSDATLFDASTRRAFSSNGDGTLTVVAAPADGHYRVLQDVATMRGARTMALDPRTHALYLLAAEYEPVDAAVSRTPPSRPVAKPNSLTLLTVTLKPATP